MRRGEYHLKAAGAELHTVGVLDVRKGLSWPLEDQEGRATRTMASERGGLRHVRKCDVVLKEKVIMVASHRTRPPNANHRALIQPPCTIPHTACSGSHLEGALQAPPALR